MPVSAQEWAASATIEAEPVSMAATVLATAMSPLATSATSTVSRLPAPCSCSSARPWSLAFVVATSPR